MEQMKQILTVGEQKEIQEYIRAKLSGEHINLDKLPHWLAELHRANEKLAEIKQVVDDFKEYAFDYHIQSDEHDLENFRGCTHLYCQFMKKLMRRLS